ncbi:MAG: MFS transporter [Gammaproteobacteria bacterium]|nr:MFS transporter [Gammaproteobacteria bacterium]
MYYGWVIVAASLVIGVTAYGTYFSFTLFYPLLVEEFGWSRTAISGVLSVGLVAYGGFALLMGWCADRFGPRITIAAGGVLFGLGTFLGSAVTELWHLYALYGGVAAVGMGAAWAPLVSTISRWFELRRGLAVGIGSLGGGTGTFFVAPFVSALLAEHSWREAYAILGVFSGGVIVIAALFMRRDPSAVPGKERARTATIPDAQQSQVTGLAFGQALRTRAFWLLVLLFGLWWLAGAIAFVQIGPFALEKGFDLRFAALAVVAMGAGNGVGKIVMGLWSDHSGGPITLRVTTTVAAVGMVCLAVSESRTGVLLAAGLFGFGFGGGAPQVTTLCVELFGLRAIGALTGGLLALIGLVGAVGPVVSGWVFDATNSYVVAFLFGGLVFVVCVELAFLLRTSRTSKQRAGRRIG